MSSSLCALSGARAVPVAEAAHRLDRVFGGGVHELASQVADVELDLLARAIGRVTPRHLQELVVAQYLIGMARQRGEQPELGGGETVAVSSRIGISAVSGLPRRASTTSRPVRTGIT